MAYEIYAAKCTACGTCADECPQGAIIPDPNGNSYVIEAGTCIDCGACESACPNGAPRPLA